MLRKNGHQGSELPSSRLASLACYAVAGRYATVLAISVTTGSLGSIKFLT